MNILRAEHISKAYAEHQALQDVSLEVPKQSVFGLLGPNGAGKTTLIRIINQIIEADEGTVFINDERLRRDHVNIIGYLPEERGLYKKMKVGEQLLYLAQLRGMSQKLAMERIKYWFKKFDIAGWWTKKLEDLSKGMAQKVQFISTVLHEPQLIILDEPFSGFDPVNAELIKNEILELRDKGATVIFSTHRMESVEEMCDHVALINKSRKVLDGKKADVKQQFRSNTFTIDFRGALGDLPEGVVLLDETPLHDELVQARLQGKEGITSNGLLAHLINQVEVHGFQELIPSMNDIFIAKVKEGSHE